jgi:hypothetical protein
VKSLRENLEEYRGRASAAAARAARARASGDLVMQRVVFVAFIHS